MKGLGAGVLVFATVVALAWVLSSSQEAALPEPAPGLRALPELVRMADEEQRAHALFNEVAKVFAHRRCANCHVAGSVPLQGDGGAPHQPMVVRASGGAGAPGMLCVTCHGEESFEGVPGAPGWILSPASLAWDGRSPSEICRGLKQARPNLRAVARYLRDEPMVAHGWEAPGHLEAAPGDRPNLVALFEAWIEAGAHCP